MDKYYKTSETLPIGYFEIDHNDTIISGPIFIALNNIDDRCMGVIVVGTNTYKSMRNTPAMPIRYLEPGSGTGIAKNFYQVDTMTNLNDTSYPFGKYDILFYRYLGHSSLSVFAVLTQGEVDRILSESE